MLSSRRFPHVRGRGTLRSSLLGSIASFVSTANINSVNAGGYSIQDANTTPVGWGTNQNSGSNNYSNAGLDYSLKVRRPGFDSSGNSTFHVDTVTVESRIRQLHPNSALWKAAVSSAVESSISDYVMSTDTIYGSDGSIGGITNNSSFAYTSIDPMSVLDLVPFTIFESSTSPVFNIYVSHLFARNGRPAASVEVIFTDGTNEVSTGKITSTTAKLYDGSGLYAPVFQVPATDVSSLNAGQCFVNYKVRPWCGPEWDAGTDGGNDNDYGNARVEFQHDKAGSFGRYHACVDSTGTCTDTTGVFSTEALMDAAIGPEGALTDTSKVYASVTTALAQITSASSRSDSSGGVVHLEEGTYTKNTSDPWNGNVSGQGYFTIVKGRAGTTRASVIINLPDANQSPDDDTPYKICLKDLSLFKQNNSGSGGINFNGDSNSGNVSGLRTFYLDTVSVNGDREYGATVYQWHRRYILNCETTSGYDAGETITDIFGSTVKGASVIGSKNFWGKTCLLGFAIYNVSDATGEVVNMRSNANTKALNMKTNGLIGHSFFSNSSSAAICMSLYSTGNSAGFELETDVGFHFVGSVFEKSGTASSSGTLQIHNDSDETETTNNILVRACTSVGAKFNFAYDDDDASFSIDRNHFLDFTLCPDGNSTAANTFNSKDDTFVHPTSGQDGGRDGNIPEQYHVSWKYNQFMEGAANGDFVSGIGNHWLGEILGPGTVSDASHIADFEDDKSTNGDQAGEGDYRPDATGNTDVITIPSGLGVFSHDYKGKALGNSGADYIGALQAA